MPPLLPPLKPISIKDRVSVLFAERGQLDVLDGSFVLRGTYGQH
jgi:CRISPR-associated protein Cas1